MENYTYSIKSFDVITNSILVEYIPSNNSLSCHTFNLTAPSEDIVDIDEYINRYAPQEQWKMEKNPNLKLMGLVGTTKIIDASKYSESTITPAKQLYEDIKRLEALS